MNTKFVTFISFCLLLAFNGKAQIHQEVSLVFQHLVAQPDFSGTIGNANQPIDFHLTSILADSTGSHKIHVRGWTKVNNSMADFVGVFEFVEGFDQDSSRFPEGTYAFAEIDNGSSHIGTFTGNWTFGSPVIGGADTASLRGHSLLARGIWETRDQSLQLHCLWESTIITENH